MEGAFAVDGVATSMASQAIRNAVVVMALEDASGAARKPRWTEFTLLTKEAFRLLTAWKATDMQRTV